MKKQRKTAIREADIHASDIAYLTQMLQPATAIDKAEVVRIVSAASEAHTIDRSITRLRNRLQHWSSEPDVPLRTYASLYQWMRSKLPG